MKKIISLVAVASSLFLVVSGCSFQRAMPEHKVEPSKYTRTSYNVEPSGSRTSNYYSDYRRFANVNHIPMKSPTNATQQSASSAAVAQHIIAFGERYYGTPYQLGARAGQTKTFDCSSFTQYVYGKNGIRLPRSSRQQSQVGAKVSRTHLLPGDLIFTSLPNSNGQVGHVGIYAGNGQVLHTWGRGGVRLDSMDTPWISTEFLFGRRVIK